MNTYGSLNLTDTSPVQSFTEPLTLAEVKAYLNLPDRSPAIPEEDDELEAYIVAARDVAEFAQGRDLVRKQWDMSFDCFPSHEIALRDPLVTVDLVRYRDSDGDYTTLTEETNYIVDIAKHPGIVMPAYGESWPSFTAWPSSAVLIRFTSGYASTSVFWSGDSGTRIRKGMKLLISAWFNNKLPFEPSGMPIQEYPFTVTSLLSFGSLNRVH